MTNRDTFSPQGKEDIAPGMSIEWLEQNQIVAFTLNSTDPEGVEKLFQRAFEIMGSWPDDRPYLAVYQVGSSQIIITQQVRKHLTELNAYRPDMKGRSAAVLPEGPANHAIRLFLMTRGKKGTRQKRFFSDRSSAVKWLREMLDQNFAE